MPEHQVNQALFVEDSHSHGNFTDITIGMTKAGSLMKPRPPALRSAAWSTWPVSNLSVRATLGAKK